MDRRRFIFDGPADSEQTVVLAHGAGAPMDSPFMNVTAEGLAHEGLRVARFEFPYMWERRQTGKRGAPDREPVLLDTWHDVIAELGGGGRVIIGGKSLGGRIATMVADQCGARGLVCLGYPFHPPGRPVGKRVQYLLEIVTPTIIVQGTRDQFGSRAEVENYKLSPRIFIEWIEDGDHSFRPRARSGRTEADNLATAIAAVVAFVRRLPNTAKA